MVMDRIDDGGGDVTEDGGIDQAISEIIIRRPIHSEAPIIDIGNRTEYQIHLVGVDGGHHLDIATIIDHIGITAGRRASNIQWLIAHIIHQAGGIEHRPYESSR